MTAHEERKQVIILLNESVTAGARRAKACEILGLSERTLHAGRQVRMYAVINVHCVIMGDRKDSCDFGQ
jgi:hypothetical protein